MGNFNRKPSIYLFEFSRAFFKMKISVFVGFVTKPAQHRDLFISYMVLLARFTMFVYAISFFSFVFWLVFNDHRSIIFHCF